MWLVIDVGDNGVMVKSYLYTSHPYLLQYWLSQEEI